MTRLYLAITLTVLGLSAGCQSNGRFVADGGDAGGMYHDANGNYRDRDTSTDTRDYVNTASTRGFTQDDYFGDPDPINRPDVYATPRDETYDANDRGYSDEHKVREDAQRRDVQPTVPETYR